MVDSHRFCLFCLVPNCQGPRGGKPLIDMYEHHRALHSMKRAAALGDPQVDVHMDSGRLTKPFVSSLGAFWPGMQALAGQVREKVHFRVWQEQVKGNVGGL